MIINKRGQKKKRYNCIVFLFYFFLYMYFFSTFVFSSGPIDTLGNVIMHLYM